MQKTRIFLWDNLRFVLILFVVVGHFLTQYLSSPEFKSLWIFIYSFHMPLFVFVSGAFHKNTKITHKVTTYIAMGVIYKIVVFISRTMVGHQPKFELFTEGGAPWYMFAMAVFVLLTYLLRNMDLRYVLVIWIIIACFAGYDKDINQFLSLSRFIVFYPFYLMGVLSNKEALLNWSKKKGIKFIALIVIGIWFALCFVLCEEFWPLNSLFAGENPFNERFYEYGFLWRLLCFAISTILCYAFILATPTKRLPVISKAGTRTLQIYFWHRPPLYFIKEFGVTATLCATTEGKFIYLLIAIAMTFFFALKPFSFPTEQIMKYRPNKTEEK